jgi:hypothetical protein
MKNLLKIFPGILILCLMLVSCKKDKNEITSYFKINDITYELSRGTLENYGTDDWYDGYNFDLTLISDGINGDNYYDWTGSGKAIYFEMFSSSYTNLSDGEYEYDDVSDIPPTFTFDYSDFSTNWIDTATIHTWIPLVSGVVSIVRDGDTYSITLTGGEDVYGSTVTAKYTGTLKYLDYTSKKSAKTRH